MRRLLAIVMIMIFAVPYVTSTSTTAHQDTEQSIIIEVEGDPKEHKLYLETYHPFVEVVGTYELLFNGLALQGSPEKLAKVHSLSFVNSLHPVHTYEVNTQQTLSASPFNEQKNTVLPADLNTTSFTGKGVKIGVIDTGIDYTHPDLAENYIGGYDLVDLDNDPMETIGEDGELPTIHGTHVAGIIAANGDLQGVAPGASIYAYRALGPGGRGSSIQVMAALEQAVKDDVDIINMSLGNRVNGPDYPTSVAVNRAVDLGVAVVIANGNDGPENWTVGSPATATNALSVGATANSQEIPFLYERTTDKTIPFTLMTGSLPWELTRTMKIIKHDSPSTNSHRGKIILMDRGKKAFYDMAKQAERADAAAVIIVNNEEGTLHGSIENEENPIQIPVASVSKQAGQLLMKKMKGKQLYIDTIYKQTEEDIASFSSRGPVTINWNIKPDILAPGTNILSAIPGGYIELNGTSMAAPHVAGAIAIMKEARPNWSNGEIIGALKTTALQVKSGSGDILPPTIQGMGKIQLERAIDTTTIIDHPLLAFGKINKFKETKQLKINIKNNTNEEQDYFFTMPRKTSGLSWKLPQAFTLSPNEQRTLPVELSITTSLLKEGIHQGWLTLSDESNTYHLPYMFINQTSDYPKAMGFDFSLTAFDDETFEYQLYVTEQVDNLTVRLYNPDTFVYERMLMQLDHVKVGLNEGYIKRKNGDQEGAYLAMVTVQLKNGTYDSYLTDIYME